jgi:hypothetical protein
MDADVTGPEAFFSSFEGDLYGSPFLDLPKA